MLDLALAAIISLSATCDASSAAAGGCGCGTSSSSFTICASKTVTTTSKATTEQKKTTEVKKKSSSSKSSTTKKQPITPAKAKPATNPTKCQEIWSIKANPAGCSKPKATSTKSQKQSTKKSTAVETDTTEQETVDSIDDQASAMVPTPLAYWYPGGTIHAGETARLVLSASQQVSAVEIFGEPAEIRFTPVDFSWRVLGQSFGVSSITLVFSEVGEFLAQGEVFYRVDYRLPASSWVMGAGGMWAAANDLYISVIEPPRRTLLVG